jgi:hypothetical protein
MFLRSKNRIGFLHLGQMGGGVFFGMMLTLDQARVRRTHCHRLLPGLGR